VGRKVVEILGILGARSHDPRMPEEFLLIFDIRRVCWKCIIVELNNHINGLALRRHRLVQIIECSFQLSPSIVIPGIGEKAVESASSIT
jgi:hypothetical protein